MCALWGTYCKYVLALQYFCRYGMIGFTNLYCNCSFVCFFHSMYVVCTYVRTYIQTQSS